MKYMGSKYKHRKEIVRVLNFFREKDQLYVEPFVGGANILAEMKNPRIANDIDFDLICLWQAVSRGWTPSYYSNYETMYHTLKYAPPSPERSYMAFALSFGGKKFGGICRDAKGNRDHQLEAYLQAQEQFPKLFGVLFTCESYDTLAIPDRSLVYCDPPYANTTEYSTNFDSTKFWGWATELSKRCTVLVSEYIAPQDWETVWTKEVASSLQPTKAKKSSEKLFRYRQ